MQRDGARWIGGALVVLCLAAGSAFGQSTNQITGVDPNSAAQGATNLLVTFSLDTDSPPAPPAGVLPDGVMLGSLSGTSVTHAIQYVVTAVFDVPSGEPAGLEDAVITFSLPGGGSLTFSMAAGFTVTAGADTPPSIAEQPQSRTVPPGGAVTFTVTASGTEPLSYQWQKDTVDISGATDASHTINPVAEADAGSYRCVVINDFGTETSGGGLLTVAELPAGAYPIVDTGQITCYDNTAEIACPAAGAAFHGQDAQYTGNTPSYALSGDGLTVFDNVTGLIWQRSPDTDRDGDIDAGDKLTWAEAQVYPATLNAEEFGGYDDWRLPMIKELFSLIDFNGMDPSSCNTEADCPGLTPFIDTDYFDFAYGDTAAGERVIDSQWASNTLYVSTVDEELLFGVNFADGRIKGYGLTPGGVDKTFLVICVRGNPDYGVNNFIDNGDDTVTDLASGPDTTSSAAIDPLLGVTSITNEEGQPDYPYYWASTTHVRYPDYGDPADYIAFGRGLGYMNGQWQDVHGAGCQRSDPKTGDPSDYPFGRGPQGDAVRIYNFVRAVRDAGTAECAVDQDCVDRNPCTDDVCLPSGECANTSLPDTDGDGVCDAVDNCASIGNPDQQSVVFGQQITVRGYCSDEVGSVCLTDDACAVGQTCLEGAIEWADPVDFDCASGDFVTSSDVGAYAASDIDSGSGATFIDSATPAPGTGRWYLLSPACTAGSWQNVMGQEPARDSILP